MHQFKSATNRQPHLNIEIMFSFQHLTDFYLNEMAFEVQLSEGALTAILDSKRTSLPLIQVFFCQVDFYHRFVLSDGRNMYCHCVMFGDIFKQWKNVCFDSFSLF